MKQRIVIGLIGILIVYMVYSCFIIDVFADGEGWLDGWDYRKSHVLVNATGAPTGYQVVVTVHYGEGSDGGGDVYLGSGCKSDFVDVRFTDNDGKTLLNAFNQTQVDGDYVVCWVEVQDNLSSSNVTIYVYYGNSEAGAYWDGYATFPDLYDDFSGDSLNDSIWQSSGEITVTDGVVLIYAGVADELVYIATNNMFSSNYSLVYSCQFYGRTISTGFSTLNAPYDRHVTLLDTPVFTEQFCTSNEGVATTTNYDFNVDYNDFEIKWLSSKGKFYVNTSLEATHTTNLPDENMYVRFAVYGWVTSSTLNIDYCFVRKCVDVEPSHGGWGSEEEFSSDAVPTYSSVGDNGVTQVGEYVTVSCFWEDDFSLNICYVEHNSTGIYTNYSISVSGSSSWANKTFQLAFTSGYKVAYRFFCSDNASQWNVTSYYYITLTPLYITFYLNNSTQGRFYVDLVNTVNNTQNGYDYNETVFLLGATYNKNYTWCNFTYSETEIVTNFYNYTTDGNKTIWCYFDICNVTVSSGDGNYTETDLHEYFALGVLISCVCVTMFLIILIDKKDLVRGK